MKKSKAEVHTRHTRSMLESRARRELTLAEYQCLDVIELELLKHGGKYGESGGIPIESKTFIEYGVRKDSVAPALRGLEELGFIRCTKKGRGGNAEFRRPGEYCLTYQVARDHVGNEVRPSDEWRKWNPVNQEDEEIKRAVKSVNEAVKAARCKKDPRHVARGKKNYKPRGLKPKVDQFKNAIRLVVPNMDPNAPPIKDWFASRIVGEAAE